MRIAFIGKGGSGKTSTCSAFVTHAKKRVAMPIAFDVDINTHLADALGVENVKPSLIERSKEVFNFLEPQADDFVRVLGVRPDIGALPVSDNSVFVRCSSDDPFLREFGVMERGVCLLTAGKYGEKDVGNACYHAKLFSSQLVAHRLLDGPDDVVAFDATAGTDPVATSLLHAYDLCIVVVEPTLKSLSVYQDFIKAADTERRTVVLANKIRSKSDEAFIRGSIPSDILLGCLPYSRDLRSAEQGDVEGVQRFSDECEEVFDHVLSMARGFARDKREYFEALHSWFSKYAEKWYDPLYDNKISKIRVPLPSQFL
jgi:CO dehydrogenase maturation factor